MAKTDQRKLVAVVLSTLLVVLSGVCAQTPGITNKSTLYYIPHTHWEGAGFESFWFCRGVPHDKLPSEFRWRGIDGTEIPAFWLPGFYGLFYGPPRSLPEFTKFFQGRFDRLTPHAAGPERVGLAGVDVSEPEDYVPPLIAAFNRQPDGPFTIRSAVPSEFARVVARRAHQPVVTN